MTDRRKHLEEALRGSAESGVPDPRDPWPLVEKRATKHLNRHLVNGQSRQRPKLLPRKRASLILTALSLLLFGTAAYAVSGLARSDLTIEEAALQQVGHGNEIVVRVRTTGSANLPTCHLLEGATRTESPWPDKNLTEAVAVGKIGRAHV